MNLKNIKKSFIKSGRLSSIYQNSRTDNVSMIFAYMDHHDQFNFAQVGGKTDTHIFTPVVFNNFIVISQVKKLDQYNPPYLSEEYYMVFMHFMGSLVHFKISNHLIQKRSNYSNDELLHSMLTFLQYDSIQCFKTVSVPLYNSIIQSFFPDGLEGY